MLHPNWKLPMASSLAMSPIVGDVVLVVPHNIYWINIRCYRLCPMRLWVDEWNECFAFCAVRGGWYSMMLNILWFIRSSQAGGMRWSDTCQVREMFQLTKEFNQLQLNEITRYGYACVRPNKHQQVHLRNVCKNHLQHCDHRGWLSTSWFQAFDSPHGEERKKN